MSCAGWQPEKSGELQVFDSGDVIGMIYDTRNRPCRGARISIEGYSNAAVISDVNGQFLIPNLPSGRQTLIATKEGFESNIF